MGSAFASSEERFLRSLFDLRSALPGHAHPRKMMVESLQPAIDMLEASSGAVAMLSGVPAVAELAYAIPTRSGWNLGLLNDHIKLRKPALPDNLIVAPVTRWSRPWGVIAVRTSDGAATTGQINRLRAVAGIVTEAIERFDDDRVDRLILSIEHKIANRQRPKDTVYDIIHGIRDLIKYDHSATLYVAGPGSCSFELVAEQITWKKARSRRIGQRVNLNVEDCRNLHKIKIGIFRKANGVWVATGSNDLHPLAECMVEEGFGEVSPEEQCLLCAHVQMPDGSTGVLKIASCDPTSLGTYEAQLVDRLMPILSLVLQFLHRTEQLEYQVLQAERKGALADLSRGIAHDVNNALGSVIPLIQQIKQDASIGALQCDLLSEDLEVVETGLQTCRRIFGGLLASARSGDRNIGNGNVRRALDSAAGILRDRIRRQRGNLTVSVPIELPVVRGNQGDITQVLLNLLTNSLDAVAEGGQISVEAREGHNWVEITVKDDGCGIPDDLLPRVTDPFVTTKATGNGLGLAICRSILWEVGGEMNIESKVGVGTTARLRLRIEMAHDHE